VTASKVLRKADIVEAGAVLGVEIPPRPRTMSDIRDLHRPWCMAVAAGLLSVENGRVTAGPAVNAWPPGDDEGLLRDWLAGLRAVCAAESYPQEASSVQMLVLALLTVLDEGAGSGRDLFGRMIPVLDSLDDLLDQGLWGPLRAADRYYDLENEDPVAGLVELLAGFGMLTAKARKPKLTPLGRWAQKQLRDDLPLPVPIDATPAEVIAAAARFEHWEDRDRVAGEWLAAREPVDAALELLTAAEDMSAFLRTVAAGMVRSLEGAARPAWQQAAEWPRLGPQAREVLTFGTGEEVSDRDSRLLVVEDAAAALEEHGIDAALTRIWEGMPGDTLDEQLAAVEAAEHADAPGLVKGVREFIASGAPRTIDEVMVLKVSLAGFRPPVWRRIEMPAIATLETLHWVIQELFAWDGDHLHVFEVGRKQYGCADMSVEDAADAAEIRLKEAFAAAGDAGGKVEYTYDLGTCWRHEITLEKMVSREPGRTYPVCVAFKGDQPVEYWSEEDPQDPEPFDLAEVNRSLSHLGSA
jgi:hypothetical protein